MDRKRMADLLENVHKSRCELDSRPWEFLATMGSLSNWIDTLFIAQSIAEVELHWHPLENLNRPEPSVSQLQEFLMIFARVRPLGIVLALSLPPLGVLGLGNSALAQPPRVADRPPEFEVDVETDVMIPARDGVKLAADLYRPARDGKPL